MAYRLRFAVAREDAYQSLVAGSSAAPELPPMGCLVVTALSSSLGVDREAEVVDKLKAAAALFAHVAPAMQLFKSWSPGRGMRRAPG